MNTEGAIQQLAKQLRLGGYAYRTIKAYCCGAGLFFKKFGDEIPSKSSIEDFLLEFECLTYRKHILVALKHLNRIIYNGQLDIDSIPYPAIESRLPEILSIEEMQRIFNVCNNTKHKAAIALMYSAGLRVGEVINLKLSDIDRSRMVINVRQGKGKKDRQCPLNKDVLKLLESYYREYHPEQYLFNGQGSIQYTAKSIQEFLKTYAKKAGINKRVHPHQLRHSLLTELFNSGTQESIIQRIAGHQRRSTTMRYVHLSTVHISNIQSPISQLHI